MDHWMPIFAMQVWYLPYLAIYLVGLVFALSRRDMGKASQHAALGFALLILGLVISSVSMYSMMTMRDGASDLSTYARYSVLFRLGTMAANVAGWAFILLALFSKRPPPISRVE